jgi:hypothetical protein
VSQTLGTTTPGTTTPVAGVPQAGHSALTVATYAAPIAASVGLVGAVLYLAALEYASGFYDQFFVSLRDVGYGYANAIGPIAATAGLILVVLTYPLLFAFAVFWPRRPRHIPLTTQAYRPLIVSGSVLALTLIALAVIVALGAKAAAPWFLAVFLVAASLLLVSLRVLWHRRASPAIFGHFWWRWGWWIRNTTLVIVIAFSMIALVLLYRAGEADGQRLIRRTNSDAVVSEWQGLARIVTPASSIRWIGSGEDPFSGKKCHIGRLLGQANGTVIIYDVIGMNLLRVPDGSVISVYRVGGVGDTKRGSIQIIDDCRG